MSWRGSFRVLGWHAASFGLAAVTAAACSTASSVHPLEDGGLTGAGGALTAGHAVSTVVSTSTSVAASSGAGGSSTCPAIDRCTSVTDCTTLSTVCIVNACTEGCCVATPAPAETGCTDSNGKVCDGKGVCVGCVAPSDCKTDQMCVSGRCLVQHCTDGTLDDGETDIDCGGTDCAPCADGKDCLVDMDCADGVCSGSPLVCQAATCSDGVQNGKETDVDCGGGTCPKCVNGQDCVSGSDCQSLSCIGSKCAAATCTDGIQNQDETDIDCGGTHCKPCVDGKHCDLGTDCNDKVCTGAPGVCQPPTCTDGVQNGTETDIDCGGSSCPACQIGEKCGGPNDCVGNICNGTCQCPQGMLDVPIQGGGVYCIDITEVTYAAYSAFYDANPPTANQAAFCSWNLNWTPGGDWPPGVSDPANPVRYVNWCQASAFCTYEGKRLCGKIGGGSIAPASFADFKRDQWFNACSSEGTNCQSGGCYPYGTSYVQGQCNDGMMGPQASTSYPNCLGGTPNLLDMSGNVAEWEDGCSATAGASDACPIRGGSYQDSPTALRCDSGGTIVTVARNYTGRDVGFRCCL